MRFWWEFSCIFVWKQLGSDCDEIFHVFSSGSMIAMRFFVRRWMVWDFDENFHVFSSESNWEVIVMRFFMHFCLETIGKWLWWEFSCIFIWYAIGKWCSTLNFIKSVQKINFLLILFICSQKLTNQNRSDFMHNIWSCMHK